MNENDNISSENSQEENYEFDKELFENLNKILLFERSTYF